MKNLVTATPREFAAQAARIAKVLDRWYKDVDFGGIRRRHFPEGIKALPDDATDEEKRIAVLEYRQRLSDSARQILLEAIVAMLEKNADETIEVLALACFVEPEDADSHTMGEYMKEISQMLYDPAVADFFISLRQSGVMQLLSRSQK